MTTKQAPNRIVDKEIQNIDYGVYIGRFVETYNQKNADITVIMPSVKQPEMVMMAIESMIKTNNTFNLHFIVVENSEDETYKKELIELLWPKHSITIINNITYSTVGWMHAEAYELGLTFTDTKWVFICHCDVIVCSPTFWRVIKEKMVDGYDLIGTMRDQSSAHAIYSCGFLVKSDIISRCDIRPNFTSKPTSLPQYECADMVTMVCEKEGKKMFVFQEKDNGLQLSIINDEVVFAHLHKGALKYWHQWPKVPERYSYDEWKVFFSKIMKN